jgi:hypothetical protein
MRVLFAILLVAISGLLWATIAAAQHIRRARRRSRGLPVAGPVSTEVLPEAPAPPPPPSPPPGDRFFQHSTLFTSC